MITYRENTMHILPSKNTIESLPELIEHIAEIIYYTNECEVVIDSTEGPTWVFLLAIRGEKTAIVYIYEEKTFNPIHLSKFLFKEAVAYARRYKSWLKLTGQV